MPLIRQPESSPQVKPALTLHLGDMSARADRLRAHAVAHARAILEEARRERERTLAGSREEGFKAGFEEGRREGHAQGLADGRREALEAARPALASVETGWSRALADFDARRDAMLQSARTEIVTLALRLAERVLRRALDTDPLHVVRQAEAALALVVRPSRLEIRVHPVDAAVLREALPDLVARIGASSHAAITTDPSLPPGSCVVSTDRGGEIDASIDTQLHALAEAILPGRGDADRSRGDDP